LLASTALSKSVSNTGGHEKYSVNFVEYYYGDDKPHITSIKIRDYTSKPSRTYISFTVRSYSPIPLIPTCNTQPMATAQVTG